MMHVGEDERAKSLARNNLNVFPEDVDAILTNAAGCGSGMHEYPLVFAGDSDAVRAEQFANKVQDISTFLADLGLRDIKGFDEPVTVAYQDACHLANAQGITSAPRQLLNAIPNLNLVELADTLCCGSAGTYNLEQPEIAGELGQRKAQTIIDSGAEVLVSGNIGCITQIQTHLAQRGHTIDVMHTIELLDRGYANS